MLFNKEFALIFNILKNIKNNLEVLFYFYSMFTILFYIFFM